MQTAVSSYREGASGASHSPCTGIPTDGGDKQAKESQRRTAASGAAGDGAANGAAGGAASGAADGAAPGKSAAPRSATAPRARAEAWRPREPVWAASPVMGAAAGAPHSISV